MTAGSVRLFIVALLFSVLPLFGARIISPGFSAPAFALAGDTLEVRVKPDSSLTLDSTLLRGPFNSVHLIPLSETLTSRIYDPYTRDSANLLLTFQVPLQTPFELYSLSLFTSRGELKSPKSVKVTAPFSKRFTLLHITDPHITTVWDTVLGYAQELQYTSHIVRAANIIAPDFVLCTGDNIMDYNQPPSMVAKWDAFFNGGNGYEGMHSLSMPLFLTTGNHDLYHTITPLQRAMQWNQSMGRRYYGFSFGTARVICFDASLGADFPDSQTLGMDQWLSRAGEGSIRIVAQHEPGDIPTAFDNAHRVKLALFGHTHRNASWSDGTTPTQGCETGSAGHFGYVGVSNVGWMRLITVQDSSILANSVFQYGNPVTQTDLLTETFDYPNTGVSNSNRAVITNNVPYALPELKIRFVMPRGTYTIDTGRIEQFIENDTLSVYDVRVSVRTRTSLAVTITPVNAAEHVQGAANHRLSVYPNPFNPSTRFTYHTLSSSAGFAIYSADGKCIRSWIFQQADDNIDVVWNGTDQSGKKVAPGLYLLRVSDNRIIKTAPVVYLP